MHRSNQDVARRKMHASLAARIDLFAFLMSIHVHGVLTHTRT